MPVYRALQPAHRRHAIVLADWDERGHYTAVDANGVHSHDIDVPNQTETAA
jgi:hypothetical protein